jgi:hypothetical protein
MSAKRSDEALVGLRERVAGLKRLRSALDAEKQRVIEEVEGIIQTLETQVRVGRSGLGYRLTGEDWRPRPIQLSKNARGGNGVG